MIAFHTGPTPNGHRAAVALEETGVPYTVHRLNLAQGDQRRPEYLAINPAGAIPAIVDPDGPEGRPITLSQSGAILLYLAEKTQRFIPADPAQRYLALQWFMQACSDAAGSNMAIAQLTNAAPVKSPESIGFFEQRLLRMLGDADRRLAESTYLAGADITVADLALYPVVAVRMTLVDRAGNLPYISRWAARLAARPGVARGMQVSLPPA